MQIYIVDDSYKNMGLDERDFKICSELEVSISGLDAIRLAKLSRDLDYNQEFIFDGLSAKDIWDLTFSTGARLLELLKLELIDEDFKNRTMALFNELLAFTSISDSYQVKLKIKD